MSPPAAAPRIELVYVTAGAGHRRAAEAIAESLRSLRPGADVSCVDLLDYCPGWLRGGYPRTYEWLVARAPSLWAIGYAVCDRLFRLIQPARRAWNLALTRAFRRHLRQRLPTTVVGTHFFVADVVAAARAGGAYAGRLVTVVTDLYPHRFWLAPEADAIVVHNEATRALCEQRGVEPRRLHALGIPINPRFASQGEVERAETHARYGLSGDRRTVLVTSGGMGVGPIEELVEGLAALEARRPGSVQLLVVCGHNQALADRLQSRRYPMPTRVCGFVEDMPALMAASDLLLTKAGGLTVMEALAVGLPMVLTGVIPGQEEMNAEFVARHQAGIKAADPAAALAAVEALITQPEALFEMRQRARALGKPEASQRIAQLILDLDRGADG